MANISQIPVDIIIAKLTPTPNIIVVQISPLYDVTRIYNVLIFAKLTFKEFKKNPNEISMNSSVKVLNGAFHQKLSHKLRNLEYINFTFFRYFSPM
jgi:hypothetical protein